MPPAPPGACDPAGGRRVRAAPRGEVAGLGDSPTVTGGSDHVGLLLELVTGELRRADPPRLVELEPGRWWLRHPEDVAKAALPLADRVEWAVFSLLSTSGGLSEAAFFDRIAGMFQGHDAPDESLVRACLESYRSLASTPDRLLTSDDVVKRSQEHGERIAALVDLGHRLGYACWIGRRQQSRRLGGGPLGGVRGGWRAGAPQTADRVGAGGG